MGETLTMPLVYVAGPITGDPFGCVRQAAAAFRVLRSYGCLPFLPQLSVLHEMVDPQPYEEWLVYDFGIIRRCDALVRLPGESKGADQEVTLARELGLPVFEWGDGVDVVNEIAEWLLDRMDNELGGVREQPENGGDGG